MIEEILIRDLGVISQSKIELGAGFNALTGETGAGKTMILTALGLLLGERADSSSVRHGSSQAIVEGHWHLESETLNSIEPRLLEAGLDSPEPELLITRSVSNDGRSRATAASRSVSASFLNEIGSKLVVVHGQSDQIRLKSATAQREALDAYAGAELQELLARYSESFERLKVSTARLNSLKNSAADREKETQELRNAVSELEKLDAQPGEDLKLAQLAERLGNTEQIRHQLAVAHEALSSENFGDSNDVLGLLAVAKRALEQGAQLDASLMPIFQALSDIAVQVREAASEVASQIASIESDSELSLDQIQERRAALNSAIRKYGGSLDEVIKFRENSGKALLDLDSSDFQIEQLEAELANQQNLTVSLAEQISTLRKQAASKLAAAVTEELQALAMPGASLVVQVTEAELGNFGADNISILLSSYSGSEPRPLGKGASGGELSRIMLAIEVVLAQGKSTPTFIFDEIDAGIGGAAAIEIGKRLAKLAKQAQVIVVTHLAQVAAFADNHLRVSKTQGEFTESSVVRLTDIGRVDELARMLSGLEDSQLARGHAAELWQMAKHSF